MKAEEAISEGLSFHLGHRIADELGIPDGHHVVDFMFNQLVVAGQEGGRYALVAKSAMWIGRHGAQNAFDLYMDDPRGYIRRISEA